MTVRMLDQFSQAPDLTERLGTVQGFFVQFGHESIYADCGQRSRRINGVL